MFQLYNERIQQYIGNRRGYVSSYNAGRAAAQWLRERDDYSPAGRPYVSLHRDRKLAPEYNLHDYRLGLNADGRH